jgi:hypothetical protein
MLLPSTRPRGADSRKNHPGQHRSTGSSSGSCRKKYRIKNYFYFPARRPSPAAPGQTAGKAASGLTLSALEKDNLREGNILEIVFKYLTNSFDYYKVKTHTNGSPFNGLNLLIFLTK